MRMPSWAFSNHCSRKPLPEPATHSTPSSKPELGHVQYSARGVRPRLFTLNDFIALLFNEV